MAATRRRYAPGGAVIAPITELRSRSAACATQPPAALPSRSNNAAAKAENFTAGSTGSAKARTRIEPARPPNDEYAGGRNGRSRNSVTVDSISRGDGAAALP